MELSEYRMPFGKYKGEELGVLWLYDKDYLYWCIKNLNGPVQSTIEDFVEEKESEK